MSRMDQRLARLETAMLPSPFKPVLTFLWGSETDNAALAALQHRADTEGLELVVIRLVAPTQQENTHVTA
jgi:hypothetical protein